MLNLDRHEGLAVLRLNRPERGNALAPDLVAALTEACAAAVADTSVHTLALVGQGPHFCTGFDLSDLDTQTDASLLLRFVQIESLLADLWHAPLRTAAFAHGRTWGAGADLFVACDQRTAAADASFRFPGAGFGLVLGTGRLAGRVGADRALLWVGSGATLRAEEAMAAGLANRSAAEPAGQAPAGLTGRADPGTTANPAAADAWLAALARPPAVSRDTYAQLKRAIGPDRREADQAALVRSAAVPGLQARIVAYRAAQLAGRRAGRA